MSTDAPPADSETSLRYSGWRVAAACFATAVFSWGFGFYGQGVYLDALARRHHWDVSVLSGASTVYYLFSAVLVMFVGDAVVRFGPRRVVLFGVTCMAVSVMLLGRVETVAQLYADYALMAFGWAATTVAAISTIVGAWFDKRRGLAISLALTGASVGGMVVTPILVVLVEQIGLPAALACGVVTMLVVLIPASAWIRSPPNSHTPGYADATPAKAPADVWNRRRALQDRGFMSVSAATALVLFAQVGFLVHQIALIAPRIGQDEAGIAVAVTAGFSVIGRVVLGGIIDRLDPRRVAAMSYLSQTLALLVMIATTHTSAMFAACALYGFSVGNVLVFPSLIVQREFPAPAFATLISFSVAISQFIYALGPGALGLIRSWTGSYSAALILCVAAELSAALIILSRRAPPSRR